MVGEAEKSFEYQGVSRKLWKEAEKLLKQPHVVTVSELALLAARQANKSGDKVLRLGIRLYLESQQTEKMAD